MGPEDRENEVSQILTNAAGLPIAVRIFSTEGDYLVPPIVFDDDEKLLMGSEVLQAIVDSGTSVDHPVLRGVSHRQLGELEQEQAGISTKLGLPLRTV